VLTVERVLTSDGKYPGRAKFADDTVKANAAMLCGKVNALLSELGVASVHVNSGHRSPRVRLTQRIVMAWLSTYEI
jgi:hypothetical protein